MFQFFVTILTGVALSTHAIIGCCWHHDHVTAHECESHPGAVHESEFESHDEQQFNDHETSPQTSKCTGSFCVYVRLAHANLKAPVGPDELQFTARSLANLFKLRGMRGFRSERFWDAWVELPPLFLRQQVWLI